MADCRKLPRDPNQRAKSVVDIATGDDEKCPPESQDSQKDQAAVNLGRRGGQKGGRARAKKLTAEERSEIARRAAQKRWAAKTGGR